MSDILRQSISIVLVGVGGTGKTFQIKSVWDQMEDGKRLFSPVLFITCEASTMATAQDILDDPGCAHVNVRSYSDFQAALSKLDQGHKGEPFRLVVFDGWSLFNEGVKTTQAKNAEGKAKDLRVLSSRSALDIRIAVSDWSAAALKHKVVMLSTCHVTEDWRGASMEDRRRVGLKLKLSADAATNLVDQSSVVLYLSRILPDFTPYANDVEKLGELIDSGAMSPTYYAVTRPCTWQGDELAFIKHQDGVYGEGKDRGLLVSPNLGQLIVNSPLRKKESK